jgi:hypothetical protein
MELWAKTAYWAVVERPERHEIAVHHVRVEVEASSSGQEAEKIYHDQNITEDH